MTAAPKKDPAAVEAEVREKIHLEILKRTGAYHANDHVLLPSGQHTSEYIEKTLVTTEPSFTEGLGGVIAKHFAPWPVDVVLSTGPGALILSHCVARAHPSRPIVVYGAKGVSRGKRRVILPVEFQRLIRPGTRVLLDRGPRVERLHPEPPDRARRAAGRAGRRRRLPVATHLGRRGRQAGLQPREPRLSDLQPRRVPASVGRVFR